MRDMELACWHCRRSSMEYDVRDCYRLTQSHHPGGWSLTGGERVFCVVCVHGGSQTCDASPYGKPIDTTLSWHPDGVGPISGHREGALLVDRFPVEDIQRLARLLGYGLLIDEIFTSVAASSGGPLAPFMVETMNGSD